MTGAWLVDTHPLLSWGSFGARLRHSLQVAGGARGGGSPSGAHSGHPMDRPRAASATPTPGNFWKCPEAQGGDTDAAGHYRRPPTKGPKSTQGSFTLSSGEDPMSWGPTPWATWAAEPQLGAQGRYLHLSAPHGGSLGKRMAACPCIPALPLWDHQFSPIGIPSHQTGRQSHTFLSRCSEKGSLHCRAPLPIMPATLPRPTAQGSALKSLICTYKNATSDQTRAAASPHVHHTLLPITLEPPSLRGRRLWHTSRTWSLHHLSCLA